MYVCIYICVCVYNIYTYTHASILLTSTDGTQLNSSIHVSHVYIYCVNIYIHITCVYILCIHICACVYILCIQTCTCVFMLCVHKCLYVYVYKQTHKKGWHPPAPKQLPTKKQKKKKKSVASSYTFGRCSCSLPRYFEFAS